MNPIIVDAQVARELELEQYVEEQAEDVAPEFEIDSVDDADFGALYRLWSGMRLLGTFYRADSDGLWVAQPCNERITPPVRYSRTSATNDYCPEWVACSQRCITIFPIPY